MHQSKKLFNDPQRTFSDLTFEFKGGRKFLAHSCIIAARCDALLPPKVKEGLASRKKKQHLVEMKDDRLTPNAFHTLLEYLYTGVVRYDQANTPAALIETYIAADMFKVERLKWALKRHWTDQLKSETASHMLRAAHDYKCEPLKQVARGYALDNYTTFISDKATAQTLGIELLQEIATGFATRDVKSPRPDEQEPAETLASDYRAIYDKRLYPDATAQTAAKEPQPFHKSLFAAHSDAFVTMFKGDDPSGGWDFHHLSPDSFRAMQRYFYFNDTEIAPLLACELVAFGRDYALADLVKLCKSILQNNVNRQTAIEILKKCCMPGLEGYDEVNRNAIEFTATHLADVDLTELRTLDPKQGHLIACELLLCYQKAKAHYAGSAPPNNTTPAAASAAAASSSSSSKDKKEKKK